jgi:phage anti-repressor protein
MEKSLNIVRLIENNPITKLSNTYQSMLLRSIQSGFTELEQERFVYKLYPYLNYYDTEEFIIELDDVWEWLGFQSKYEAKRILEQKFAIDIDYKFLPSRHTEQPNYINPIYSTTRYILNVRTFKTFCMNVKTKRAVQMHDYYIRLEKILQEVFREQCIQTDLYKTRENTLIEQLPNTQCVYYCVIDNMSNNKEQLIKFGETTNLEERMKDHRSTYSNCYLINAFRVKNSRAVERAMKQHIVFKEHLRKTIIKGKKRTELLAWKGMSLDDIDKYIKECIHDVESNYYDKLVKLEQEHSKLLFQTNVLCIFAICVLFYKTKIQSCYCCNEVVFKKKSITGTFFTPTNQRKKNTSFWR